MFLFIGFAIFLLCLAMFTVMIGGNLSNFIDFPSLLIILIPLVGVLVATRSFKVFHAGLRAAFFPKEEIAEELRGRSASLFRLLSKAAVMAGGMGTFIGLVNMLMNLDFSDVGGVTSLCINLAYTLIPLLYGILIAVAVLEPIVFILKKRYAKKR